MDATVPQLGRVLGRRGALTLLLGAALVSAAAAAVHFGPRLYYRVVPPTEHGHPIGDAEAAAFAEAARRFSGRIVWSSNRSGNHEIYLLDLRGKAPVFQKLTDDPHVDTFPRFSADGSKIVFNRSRDAWVSERDPLPWDVWLMNADGTEPKRLAEHGFHATFTEDERAVVFARSGEVVRHELDGGRENVLADVGKTVGGRGQEPDLRGQLLAITNRGGLSRAYGIYDLGSRELRAFPGSGCQIGWWPGRDRLIWIDGSRGNGGTQVAWGPVNGSRAETLIDLPGQWSHEYFPRLSRDGQWLAWAASKGDHEPDRADYEIFLWRVGEPWDRAMRLTYHTGNDQWPDVLAERR
jgi:hypothetical protein